jgi:uncharacterized protein (TIGR02145 family)
MKETGTTHWNDPNNGATNESGFTGLPAGVRNTLGNCFGIGGISYFWSTTELDISVAYYRGLYNNLAAILRDNSSKQVGFSVRCVKD